MRSWLAKVQIVVAAALLLIGAGLILVPRVCKRAAPESPSSEARLLPDTRGPMTLAVCSVNSARRAALRNADLVSNIVNTLPPRTRIVLLVNDRQAFTVAANPWPDRVTFLELPDDKSFTIWPQDPFVVLFDEPDTDRQPDGDGDDKQGNENRSGSSHSRRSGRILVSRAFARADDRIMARAIAEHIGWKWEEASLDFEGGNLVADERYVFIGGNTIRRNALTEQLPETEIAQRFQQQLGREVIVIGPVPQPIGHIDLMLTPLGNGRLALADSGWGARLVQEHLVTAPDAVKDFERRCEAMYFGDPHIRQLIDRRGNIVRPPDVVGGSKRAIEHSRQVAPVLDRLANDLRSRGFEVHRMPMLFAPSSKPRDGDESRGEGEEAEKPEQAETAPDDGNLRERPSGEADPDEAHVGYPCLTYNNVLLETVAGGPIVYLPQYGLPVLDDAARREWQELGFEIRVVKGLAISAMYGGSLRCCVKVLARD